VQTGAFHCAGNIEYAKPKKIILPLACYIVSATSTKAFFIKNIFCMYISVLFFKSH
jgi:hypothetical protein